MIKPKECVVLVSSVQDVIKFYTEKLAFDIVDLTVEQEELQAVRLRKGKCFFSFKRPNVQESVEFSFIKRCPSRCLTISIEVTKDLDKLIHRYEKKNVNITTCNKQNGAIVEFTIKDPFGISLHFFKKTDKTQYKKTSSTELFEDDRQESFKNTNQQHERIINKTIEKLQSYGIVRRAAKKFCKTQLKAISKH